MFPFQESNQWMSQISSYNGESSAPDGSNETHQDLVLNPQNVDSEEKKKMHRDIERERRKQMASLLTQLRSLLPLEFIKGKCSKADLLNEAVNYIKHLRRNITELHVKRDALTRLSNARISGSQIQISNVYSSASVVVKPYSDGFEIVISIRDEGLQLSKVMQVLLEQNVDVECCSSSKVNDRMFHTIQSKVVDSTRINLPELQHKLWEVCNSWPSGA